MTIRSTLWRPLSCFAVMGVFWGGWGALVPAVKASAGANDAELGLALLVLAAVALPAMLVSGRFIDRFGDRTLAPATAAFGVAAFLPGFAGSVPMLVAGLAAVGAASGALDVTMNAAVAAEEARRGRPLMHLAHAIFSAGVLASAVLVGLARSGGAEPIHVTAVLGALILAVAAVVRLAGTRAPLEEGRTRVSRRPIALSRPLLVLGGLCALSFVVENALESWSALHLERTLGAAPAVGGLGPGLFAAAAMSGRLAGQALARHASDPALLVGAGSLGAAGTALVAFAPSPPVALAGVVVAGAGISVAAPTLFSLTGRVTSAAERGSAMASVTAIAYLGFVLGPPLVGGIAAVADLRLALAVVAGVSLLLAGLTRFLPRG